MNQAILASTGYFAGMSGHAVETLASWFSASWDAPNRLCHLGQHEERSGNGWSDSIADPMTSKIFTTPTSACRRMMRIRNFGADADIPQ